VLVIEINCAALLPISIAEANVDGKFVPIIVTVSPPKYLKIF
jgi:hypothetical protein